MIRLHCKKCEMFFSNGKDALQHSNFSEHHDFNWEDEKHV